MDGEHSLELHLLKIHSRGPPITPWGWMGLIFWTMSFYNPKSSYNDLSNEGSKTFLSSLKFQILAGLNRAQKRNWQNAPLCIVQIHGKCPCGNESELECSIRNDFNLL